MERITRSQHDEAMQLPFTGLGHDVSSVATVAEHYVLTPVRFRKPSPVSPSLPPEYLPVCNGYGSGFAMLIGLGRETRGR